MSEIAAEAETAEPKKPEKSAYEKLSPRFRLFVDMILQGESGAEVARKLGWGGINPRVWASRVRARPDVKAAIEEREAEAMHEAGITLTRTWIEVRRIAFFDKRRLYDASGALIPVHMLDDDTAGGIAGIEVEDTRTGPVRKYKAWNKNDALKTILQAKGELVDKHELAGPGGKELNTTTPPIIQIVRYSDMKAEDDAGTDSAPAE